MWLQAYGNICNKLSLVITSELVMYFLNTGKVPNNTDSGIIEDKKLNTIYGMYHSIRMM